MENIQLEQHELYENARRRIKQKKRLYFHFVLLVVGALFFFIANKWLDVYPEQNWFVWAIVAWTFLFIMHFIKVFITDTFMNKTWERQQIERLVQMQQKRIIEIEKDFNLKNNITN